MFCLSANLTCKRLFIYFAFTHLSLCLFIRGNHFTDGCIYLEFLKVKSVVMRRLELIESSVPAYSLYPQFKSRLGWNFDFAICWTNQWDELRGLSVDATTHYPYVVSALSKTLLLNIKATQSCYRLCTNIYLTKDFPKAFAMVQS